MRLTTRTKRSRQTIRLVRPMELAPNDFVYPIFLREDGKRHEIPSMKGQKYLSLKDAAEVCHRTAELGIPAVMIFAVLNKRNKDGTVGLREGNFNSEIFRHLKKELDDQLVLISNVCMCTYTTEEYCVYSERGKVLHDKTAKMLAKISVAHAEAGADMIAPSAMADGQVKEIRNALDDNGFDDIPIMSYIKSNSLLFQPFFEAVTTSKTPRTGVDSSKFRADYINTKMFLQKLKLDIGEGADIVIIKPAITNLDIIKLAAETFPETSISAFQVSGEYAFIKSLSKNYKLDENKLLMEMLYSIKRAGADSILTYHALQAAEFLREHV